MTNTIVVIAVLALTKCGPKHPFTDDSFQDRADDEIDLDQEVTIREKPTDSLFANFTKFWPTQVSSLPELTLPVIPLDEKGDDVDREEPWNPRVSSACVFSEEAGIVVPEVTLTWAEPVRSERPARRSDLTVHYQGFQKNLYTTFYPLEPLNRFNIPGNSEFLNDTAAILLTGTTLFPKVRAYDISLALTNQSGATSEAVDDTPSTEYEIYSVTLRDLSPGLSYTIRLCELTGESWDETKSFVFTTPICKNKF